VPAAISDIADHRLTVVHTIPGRLRLRVPAAARTSGMADAVGRRDGVTSTQWSPRTRSLLVRYQPETIDGDEIARMVAQHAGVALPPEAPPASAPVDGRSPVAIAMADVVAALNRGLAERTRGTLDLGTLLPLGLVVWALREVLRGQVAPLAWSSALWYAHGLFRDYNVPPTEP
jgi:hypothetical protein